MSKPLPRPTPRSRYSYARITREIARELEEREVGEQKLVADAAGLDESAFSHRMVGVRSRFTVEQLGCIADHWRMPAGWPFSAIDATPVRLPLIGLAAEPGVTEHASRPRKPAKKK